LTISAGHTNDGQKAKEETRQSSSLRPQSLTSLGLAQVSTIRTDTEPLTKKNDPEYLGIKEIEL